MPKMAWDEFVARHRRSTAVFAIHPRLPKALMDSFRRDGYRVPTPSLMLTETLQDIVQGDWALRTETTRDERPARSDRKGREAQAKRSIVLLSDGQDVRRIQAAIGRIIRHDRAEALRGCNKLRDLEYGRKEYLRLLLHSASRSRA